MDKTGQNVRIFKEVIVFLATYSMKTEKQTLNSLSSCQFDAGMLAEGKTYKTNKQTTHTHTHIHTHTHTHTFTLQDLDDTRASQIYFPDDD